MNFIQQNNVQSGFWGPELLLRQTSEESNKSEWEVINEEQE